jgi:hypothetical protein
MCSNCKRLVPIVHFSYYHQAQSKGKNKMCAVLLFVILNFTNTTYLKIVWVWKHCYKILFYDINYISIVSLPTLRNIFLAISRRFQWLRLHSVERQNDSWIVNFKVLLKWLWHNEGTITEFAYRNSERLHLPSPRFEPRISRIQVYSLTATSVRLVHLTVSLVHHLVISDFRGFSVVKFSYQISLQLIRWLKRQNGRQAHTLHGDFLSRYFSL